MTSRLDNEQNSIVSADNWAAEMAIIANYISAIYLNTSW